MGKEADFSFMITKDEVMPLLLSACPSFRERWNDLTSEVGFEASPYIDIAEFVRHLLYLHRANKMDEFTDVFNVVERMHTEGDSYVRELATIGFLEGIQNILGNSDMDRDNHAVDPNVFVKYLRPESLKSWNDLNDFWNKNAA